MYFGTSREQYLTPDQSISLTAKDYTFPADLSLNNFAFEGNWKFSSENIESEKAGGKIKLKFHSGKLHLVAESDSPNVLHVTVDGKTQPDVTVSKSMLYTLFDSNNYTDHEVEITVSDPGFRGFTFTFG